MSPAAFAVRIQAVELYYLPIEMRMPLKFGIESVTCVTCARAKLTVADSQGRTAEGWGETPLAVQWAWPSDQPYEPRHLGMRGFCERLAAALVEFDAAVYPLELRYGCHREVLPDAVV